MALPWLSPNTALSTQYHCCAGNNMAVHSFLIVGLPFCGGIAFGHIWRLLSSCNGVRGHCLQTVHILCSSAVFGFPYARQPGCLRSICSFGVAFQLSFSIHKYESCRKRIFTLIRPTESTIAVITDFCYCRCLIFHGIMIQHMCRSSSKSAI